LSVVRKHLAEVESKVAKLQQIQIELLSMAGTCESTCLGSNTPDCTIVEPLFEPAAGARSGCCSQAGQGA
jgi:MerR family mercuric resistance operon transcriptional regulator